jgi:hypothetical protein
MAEHAASDFTPTNALQTLERLENYEESLTYKVGGLTWMVWAVAVPGIFLTYNVAPESWTWQFALLWIPWILVSSLVTGGLWRTHAISVRKSYSWGRGWLTSLAFTAIFFAIMGVFFLVAGNQDTNVKMTIITGVFTVLLGFVHHRSHGPHAAIPGLVAGILVCAAGALAGVLDLTGWQSAYVGAGTVMATYVAGGMYLFTRG